MFTALTLAAAVGLIAVQPLLLRTWPWLDRYGFPRRPATPLPLWHALRTAAAALPVPAPPPAPPPARAEYRTGGIAPTREVYDPIYDPRRDGPVTDPFLQQLRAARLPAGVPTSALVHDVAAGTYSALGVTFTAADLANLAQSQRQQLELAALDGHRATLEAIRCELDLRQVQEEYARHLAVAEREYDRQTAITSIVADRARRKPQ